MLKYALLGFLQYEPKTGYDLKQTVDGSTNHFWHAKQSQIYSTLKQMEMDGLVQSHAESQESRPDRKVYTITELGKSSMHTWLQQPVTKLETPKQLLLLKLFFSGNIEKETILTQLRLLRNLHEQQINVYKTEAPDFINQISDENPELRRDAVMWEATRCFGEKFENMYIDWLDETIQMIKKNY